MKAKFENVVDVRGYVFDHNLQKRTSRNGVDYIGGIINIATDENGMNVVPVEFIYVTETYAKSGKPNSNYGVLEKIIEDNNTYSVNGTEAQKVRVTGNIGVNDFVTRDGEMASPKRVTGSFIHTMSSTEPIPEKAATFEADMLIVNAIEREVEEGDDYVTLSGYVFDFRNSALPIDLTVRSQGGMEYFMGQDISKASPLCTKVWGDIVSTTIVREKTVESAFGAPKVEKTSRTFRAWDVDGCSTEPYEWDDESFITKAELKEALATREEHLADVRKRHEEYQNSKSGKSGFPTSATTEKKETKPAEDDFPF